VPAVGILVAAALDAGVSIVGMAWHFMSRMAFSRVLAEQVMIHQQRWAMGFFPFGMGFVWHGFSLLVDAAIIYGALQMQRGQSYGWAVAAALLAIIPCISSPCCCLGLPFGIWALVVLMGEEGRRAFAGAPPETKI
jgi:hypothetical protein